jgi:ribosomal silencing factor RsfS
MIEVAIKLPKNKLIEGLSALPVREIKEIMDALIERELFRARMAKAIYREASKTVRSKKLHSQVAEEAVRWARSKK